MTHSEPWNRQCPDHQIWRQLSDYCNYSSCKAGVNVSYSTMHNALENVNVMNESGKKIRKEVKT